jgi:hypothetical protein
MLRLCLAAAVLLSAPVQAQDAAGLRARHTALQTQLAKSPFGRPMHVESTVNGGTHKGEIHAVVDQPYAAAAAALARPGHWCEILTLQVNVKRCQASNEALAAFITRKPRDGVGDAHQIDFRFNVPARRADYLEVKLNAPSGPMSTKDYEIRLEATPLDAKRTFLHLTYTYTLGTMARVAMEAYLAGPGRDKTGFTIAERKPDGSPVYVDGVRGVVERSAMRYYLAIDASLPAGQPLDTRLTRWYSGVERYPQLRERVGRDEYVEMKRREAAS